MTDKKLTYVVKAGREFGWGDNKTLAGGTVELTEQQAAPFLDLLELQTEPQKAAPKKAASKAKPAASKAKKPAASKPDEAAD